VRFLFFLTAGVRFCTLADKAGRRALIAHARGKSSILALARYIPSLRIIDKILHKILLIIVVVVIITRRDDRASRSLIPRARDRSRERDGGALSSVVRRQAAYPLRCRY